MLASTQTGDFGIPFLPHFIDVIDTARRRAVLGKQGGSGGPVDGKA
jgi:hypothetical protein